MQQPFSILKLAATFSFAVVAFTAGAQNAESLIKTGDSLFYAEKFDSALLFYNRAVMADPNSYEAYFSRAAVYRKKKQYNLSVAEYSKAIAKTPADSTEWLASLYNGRGFMYESKGVFDSALTDYTKATHLHPSHTEYWSRRGTLYYNTNNYNAALKDFSNAISLSEGDPELYRSRSKAYYCLDMIDSALNDINRIIPKDESADNYNYRGLFYNKLGLYDSSVNDFLTNLKKYYRFGNTYINIISPLVRQQKFQEAAVFYNLFLDRQYLMSKINPKQPGFYSFLEMNTYSFYTHYIKAADLVSGNKLEEALLQLDTASIKYGTEIKSLTKRCYVDVLALRGYVLEKLERKEDARACYEQALVIDSRQPDVKQALENMELMRALSITRRIDNISPSIKGVFADTVKQVMQQNNSTDSITIKIRGTAYDETGIKEVKVDSFPVNGVEEDGFFRFALKKKKSDSNPVIVTATDSSGNTAHYTLLKEEVMRGGVVTAARQTDNASLPGKYYAILIAEKDYADSNIKSLNYPIRDANKLKEILTAKYTFDPENVDTLYNRNREDILETIIARCKSLGKNDNLLIFYAGHGDTTIDVNENVDGYLVPVSARKKMTSYFITSEDIKKALLRSNAKHVLLLLDACYSGAFTRSNDEGITGDILSQWKSPSRKVMTSGNVEEVPDQSFFIRYLTDYLKENDKPFITAKDVWNYVDRSMKNVVKEEGKGKFYNPQFSAITGVDDKGGSFIFVLRKKD
jgi:tetratricopeptide (TPR) repeat protein